MNIARGGPLFENSIARRIVILAGVDVERNILKLKRQRQIVDRENLRIYFELVLCMFGTLLNVIMWSLLPFVAGAMIILLLWAMNFPYFVRNMDQGGKIILYTDQTAHAAHRMVCSLSDVITAWFPIVGYGPIGIIFKYWEWVCYVLVGNTCHT